MLPRLTGCLSSYRLQGSAAFSAKASCRPINVTTGAALNSEGSPASFAKIISGLILMTATQTLHQLPLHRERTVDSRETINLFADQFHAALQQPNVPAHHCAGGLKAASPRSSIIQTRHKRAAGRWLALRP